MFGFIYRTYIEIFRRFPVLVRIGAVALLAEILFASVNNYALPFYVLDDLRQPGRVLGLLISTFLIVEMLLKLPFGHLSDRCGRRILAALGLGLCVVTPAVICLVPLDVFLLAPGLVLMVLLPLRALDGVGAAALWPPLFAAVPDHVPERHRGVAMSILNVSYLAGLAIGPSLGGVAMKLFAAEGARAEWVGKAPFLLAAAAALAGALVARTLPRGAEYAQPAAAPGASFAPRGRAPLGSVMFVTFGEMFAVATLAPYLAPYVREVTQLGKSDVGFLLLLLFVPAALLGVPIGHLTDRWPKHRVAQGAFLATALGLWGVPACHSLGPLLAVGVLVTIGFLFGLPAWMGLIADLAPAGKSGRVMGMMATAQGLGAFLGPLLGGHLWDLDVRYPWYAAAAVLTVAALAAVCCVRTAPAGGAPTSAEGEPPLA